MPIWEIIHVGGREREEVHADFLMEDSDEYVFKSYKGRGLRTVARFAKKRIAGVREKQDWLSSGPPKP
jgi:hypothetical protein